MIFFWYSLAGGAATAVHYAVLLILVEGFAVAAAPSAAAGALCGAAVSYLINRHVTFPGTTMRHQQAVPRFMLIALLGAAANGALVWAGVHLLSWHYLVAQAL
ncbi:MAG: polysaccharide synthesis protein GtrA, partial [Polaromonas sp.]|nr:polysaccharide synthesis protein GtrA [Polaromonas sp.]